MREQKSIVISSEVLRLKNFINTMLSGVHDPAVEPEQCYGEWQGHAGAVYEYYVVGYNLNQDRAEAASKAKTCLKMMLEQDPQFKIAYEMSEHEEEDDDAPYYEATTMPPLPASVFEGEEEVDTTEVREWLDAFIAWMKYWSPRGHAVMAEAIGIWLLSLLAARRIRIPGGNGMYTSLYVMLAADTGAYAKSTTVGVAKSLLEYLELDHLLTPGEMTPEVFLRGSTGKAPDNWDQLSAEEQMAQSKELAHSGQRGICFDEFGAQLASLSQPTSPMKGFYRIFLTWSDSPRGKDAAKHTIGRGSDIPRDPYLALLTCLTVDNVINGVKPGAMWNDGFFARQVIISPPENEWNNEMAPAEDISFPSSVTGPLRRFYEKLGVPHVTSVEPEINGSGKPTGHYKAIIDAVQENVCTIGEGVREARIRYDNALSEMRRLKLIPSEFKGNYLRFPYKALQVAALLAWMNNGGRIELAHWIAARDIVERWRLGLHEFYAQLNAGKISYRRSIEDKVMNLIKKWSDRGGLTASMIGQRVVELDSEAAYKMLESMANIGKVAKYKVPAGKAGTLTKIIYKAPGSDAPANAIYENKEQGKE